MKRRSTRTKKPSGGEGEPVLDLSLPSPTLAPGLGLSSIPTTLALPKEEQKPFVQEEEEEVVQEEEEVVQEEEEEVVQEEEEEEDPKDGIVAQYEEKLHEMTKMMEAQQTLVAHMLRNQQKQTPTITTATPDAADNVTTTTTTTTAAATAAVTPNNRRENVGRPFEQVYASEQGSVSPNITLTDASAGRWGSMSQTQTNVGMRTRALMLNPSLQQPSIGGLM